MLSVIKKLICLLLPFVFAVVIFTSCAGGTEGVSVLSVASRNTGSINIVPSVHSTDDPDFGYAMSSGFLKLFFDKKTCAPAIYDSSASCYWTALPEQYSEAAAVFNVKLSSAQKVYYLNSQDNSVAFSSYSIKTGDSDVTVTYYLSDNAETVKKSVNSLAPGEVYAVIPVVYTLLDGSLRVSINCADISVSSGFVLESIDLLPYFGALSYEERLNGTSINDAQTQTTQAASEEDEKQSAEKNSDEETTAAENTSENKTDDNIYSDFLLVPDGCGALIYTKTDDEATSAITFDVYGGNDNSLSACAGVFGIRKEGAAMAAVINGGDAIADINAKRSSATADKANIVYPTFNITETDEKNGNVYYSQAYTGEISVCYRFMSGNEANYISMASACREQLIRSGYLSSASVNSDELALNISVICSYDGKSGSTVTTFEEAENVLSVLKSKGIESVNVLLKGIFPGGTAQKKPSSLSVLSRLGGESALKALCDYAGNQKFNVFAAVNIASAAQIPAGKASVNIFGNTNTVVNKNSLAPYLGETEYTLTLYKASQTENNVISVMNNTKNYGFSGLCLLDAAKTLYSDYSEAPSTASQVSDILSENTAAFSTRQLLMLSGCNFNVIRTASYLVDVPLHTSLTESNAYEAVPFIMAILHSTIEYSGKPVNTYPVSKLEMLKSIEYGAVPYYEWVADMKSDLYYGYELSDAVDFSLRATKELSDLITARITAHKKLESGVFCTQYDSGSLVYVNYNNYSVAIGDITVMPYDYIRIN